MGEILLGLALLFLLMPASAPEEKSRRQQINEWRAAYKRRRAATQPQERPDE